MRHKHGYRKLGREGSHRKAMLRNLATSLVTEGRITTTVEKAKELKRVVEKLVTTGKSIDKLSSRRAVAEVLFTKLAVKKLCDEISIRMKDRPGGYTRILRRGIRFGDGAKLATIEFVE